MRLASALLKLDLVPEVIGEGDKMFRFLGLQSKNRKEWFLLHLANFYAGATSVIFHDTLKTIGMKFII